MANIYGVIIMNSLLLGIVSFIYVFVAINYLRNHNLGMSIAFFAYAVSNVGLYIAGTNQ